MTDATETLILISGSSVDIDANAGEGSGKRFSGHTNAIWKFGNLIEFDGILKPMSRRSSVLDHKGAPFVGDLSLSQNFARQTSARAWQILSLLKLLWQSDAWLLREKVALRTMLDDRHSDKCRRRI
jgi:hypothetical protein